MKYNLKKLVHVEQWNASKCRRTCSRHVHSQNSSRRREPSRMGSRTHYQAKRGRPAQQRVRRQKSNNTLKPSERKSESFQKDRLQTKRKDKKFADTKERASKRIQNEIKASEAKSAMLRKENDKRQRRVQRRNQTFFFDLSDKNKVHQKKLARLHQAASEILVIHADDSAHNLDSKKSIKSGDLAADKNSEYSKKSSCTSIESQNEEQNECEYEEMKEVDSVNVETQKDGES